MKRGLLIGGGVLVAVLIVVVAVAVYVFSNLGSLIKTAVEKYGTEVVQAPVTLNSADVSIKSGQGALKGLVVANPKGFQTPNAFKLGAISVTLDTNRLSKELIAIKEIVIDAPDVTYELAGGGSNIDAIQKNVNSYMAQLGGGAKKEEKAGEGPKLTIDNLYVRNGKVNVSAGFLKGKAMSAPLPTIHLADIGKDKKGATPAEVAQKLISAITKSATSAVGTLNLDKLKDMATGAAGAAGDAAKKAMEGAGSAGSGASDAAKGAADKLKGMFGK